MAGHVCQLGQVDDQEVQKGNSRQSTLEVLDWSMRIIIFYIIIVNFVLFHLFQFSNYLLVNKSISRIASSVQKKTAEERTKETNTYNSLKIENSLPYFTYNSEFVRHRFDHTNLSIHIFRLHL